MTARSTPDDPATHVDALVVGAGPAGLTAALALGRRGCSVLVLEAAAQTGGMAASRTVAGIRVDLGSHRLHPVASPRVEELLTELLGDDLQVRPRHGRLRLGERWVGFPLRATDLVTSLPPRFATAAACDAALGPVRRLRRSRRRDPVVDGSGRGANDTFAGVVRDGLGPAMLEDFYGPYAKKLWGRPAEELAGDLARRRIAASSPGRLLAKVARAARREPIVFRYPRHGYGQVVDRLAEECLRAGVGLETGRTVRALDRAACGSSVTLDDGRVLEVGRVLWSAPLASLARVLGDAPTAEVRHRSMVLVYLVFAGDRVTEFDAHYLPGPESIATRVSEPTNYRDGPDPADRTVICAEIPCDLDDDVWNESPSTLGARIADDLARLGVTDRRPVSVEVERLPHVYPVITPADVEPLERLHDWAAALPGVTVFGRQGLFVADNLHHVMDMGLAAADCLGDDGTWDASRWAAALDHFATHVVED